jgi:hypothetical protein
MDNSGSLIHFQLQELKRYSCTFPHEHTDFRSLYSNTRAGIHQLTMIASLVYVAVIIALLLMNSLRFYYHTHPGDGSDPDRPTGEAWE